MKTIKTSLPGVLLFEPKVYGDRRGFFIESWSKARYQAAGISGEFVQDNLSFSSHGILRGLHFQHPRGQGKLVQVLSGSVFDVAVDIRPDSPYFGKWFGAELTSEHHNQMYVPAGFAHGFYVLSDTVLFSYKCTDYYSPETECSILWNDPDIGIQWPLEAGPILSDKDAGGLSLSGLPKERLPHLGDYA